MKRKKIIRYMMLMMVTFLILGIKIYAEPIEEVETIKEESEVNNG